MGVTAIERLRWWHIDELLPIEADLFGVEKWSAAMFWNELANGHFYIVARVENDDAIAGYAGVALQDTEAWVQNVAVRRDKQRHGIGRALVEALLAEAAKQGADRVLLEVAVDNLPAQRLYGSYGFKGIGVRRGYYQPSNTDALIMEREKPRD